MKRTRSCTMMTRICVSLLVLALLAQWSPCSDFPRDLWQCPPQGANQWDSLQAIGANLIWNYRGNWTDLGNYLDSLYTHGMQSVLSNAYYYPYRIDYYAQAQYMQYQADMEYDAAC